MIDIKITVNAADKKRALKKARAEAARRVKPALVRVGERTVLPTAKRRAWSVVADKIVVRASSRAAWLTTKGRTNPEGRIAGLMEFGGTVRTIIRPRKAGGALGLPWGARAAVKTPRVYKPRAPLQIAVRQRIGAYEEGVVAEVAHAFDDLERA